MNSLSRRQDFRVGWASRSAMTNFND